jgi:hypothetical protein
LNNFIIVGTQRTGSSAIAAALSTHPEIACGWEWTQRVLPPWKLQVMSKALQRDFSSLDQKNRIHMESIAFENINWLGFRRLFRSSNKWILHPKFCPALYIDRFNGHLVWFAKRPSLHIIHIVRHDNLAWLRSKFLAQKTKLYIGKEYPKDIKVKINIKEATKRLKAKKWIDDQLTMLKQSNPYIHVSFEDFVSNNRSVVETLVSFLQCNPADLPVRIIKTAKQSTTPIEQSIINYDELISALTAQNILTQPTL